jgi:hypothetical protein
VKNNIMRILLLLAVGLVGLTPAAHGESPTWARKATVFQVVCRERSDFHKCKSFRIPSPDKKSSVEVVYEKVNDVMVAFLQLATPGRGIREIALPYSNQNFELLWSPNSKAFFIDWGFGSSISGFKVSVYLVDSADIDVGLDLTQEVTTTW